MFIGNYAGRSGAPLRLLEIVRFLKEQLTDVLCTVLLLNSGVLVGQYERVCDKVLLLKNGELKKRSKLLYYLKYDLFFKRYKENLYKDITQGKYELIYANSVSCIQVAVELKMKLNKPLLLHVRELDIICKKTSGDLIHQFEQVDQFVAISKAVKEMLVQRFEVPEAKVALIYTGTNLKAIKQGAERIIAPKRGIMIGGSGTVDWRKGVDIFILVARKVLDRFPDVKFEWLGSITRSDKMVYEADLEKLMMKGSFQFVEEIADPVEVMKRWHLFLSTAREEALGVACLEAGALGIPILTFDKSGGTSEIIENGGGKTVPYFDVQRMADEICALVENDEAYNIESGRILSNIQKFDISSNLPKLLTLVKRYLK